MSARHNSLRSSCLREPRRSLRQSPCYKSSWEVRARFKTGKMSSFRQIRSSRFAAAQASRRPFRRHTRTCRALPARHPALKMGSFRQIRSNRRSAPRSGQAARSSTGTPAAQRQAAIRGSNEFVPSNSQQPVRRGASQPSAPPPPPYPHPPRSARPPSGAQMGSFRQLPTTPPLPESGPREASPPARNGFVRRSPTPLISAACRPKWVRFVKFLASCPAVHAQPPPRLPGRPRTTQPAISDRKLKSM